MEDIVDGSLIKVIDGKRVGHWLPKDIKNLLSMLTPPIEIVFESFVTHTSFPCVEIHFEKCMKIL